MTGTVARPDGGVDVDAVARAVSACPSVAALSGGVMGEVATYLPGRRVTGVRVRDGGVEVHVVARWVSSLPAVGDEIRVALAPVVAQRPVTVFIDDLTPADGTPQPPPAARPRTPARRTK